MITVINICSMGQAIYKIIDNYIVFMICFDGNNVFFTIRQMR